MAEVRRLLDVQLAMCERLIGRDSSGYLDALRELVEYVNSFVATKKFHLKDILVLSERLGELHSKALDWKHSVAGETLKALKHLVQLGVVEIQASELLSQALFATPIAQELSRDQHELINWLTPGCRFGVKPKAALLKDADSSIVAIRWLSFRVAIRKNPGPLRELAAAVAACRKRKVVEGSSDEEDEERCKKEVFEERFHYNLVEAMCIHAASGQPGIDMKRLPRAENKGEDITVVLKGKKTAIEMKRVLSKAMVGTDLQKLLALADVFKQLLFYMLEHLHWTGRQVGALVFAHLLFCVDITFVDGKVEQLVVSPGLPSFRGSKEPMLQLYERERLYKSADPNVVFDATPSDGFKGLVMLVNQICLVNEVPLQPLRFVGDDGEVLEVVVGQELVYNGRNSVVLSCKNQDDKWPSSILKVAPSEDSCLEEDFHDELDKIVGVRRKIRSGYVTGAGSDLRFIQLTEFGAVLGRIHMDEDRVRALAEQACETVQGIHKLGVLHRDIKPSNFIVVGDQLLLNDFDLACNQEDTLWRCFLVGTPMFKSPRLMEYEQYEPVDDWMSLGLTFMYLTGAHRSKHTALTSLRKIETAAWAPDVLKANVAAGLELTKVKLAQAEVEKAETSTRTRNTSRRGNFDEDEDEEF